MRRVPMIALAVACAAAASGEAAAQTAGLGSVPSIEVYRFNDPDAIGVESLSLLTVPLAVRLPLGSAMTLDVNGGWAKGTMTREDGSTASVTGVTDTEVRLTARLAGDAVSVTVVALAPTGQDRLSLEQADVAGAFAADMLPFRLTNWGSGGGLGAAIAFARQFGATGVGLSTGYVVANEFNPLADQDFRYRPGDQFHVTGALARTFGSSAKAALNVTYQRFSVDESNGLNLYQAGNRLQARGSLSFASGSRSSGVLYLGYLHRAEGELEQPFALVPARNLLFTGGALRTPLGGAVLTPGVDFRVLSRGDGGYGGFTGSLGVGMEAPLGSALFIPTARGRFGSVEDQAGNSSGFTGFELSLGLRFGAGR